MSPSSKAARTSYTYFQPISTRWKDNDLYGHVNNVEYYSFFDTVINKWLIQFGGLDIHRGEVFGVCAESNCRFLSSIAFPGNIDAGLSVSHVGRTSVRYELGLFAEGSEELIAQGWFVHVFVSRETRRPMPIPDKLRLAFASISTKTLPVSEDTKDGN